MDYFHESREKTGKLQALHVDAIYSCRRHNKPSGKKKLYKLPLGNSIYSTLNTKIRVLIRQFIDIHT